MSEEKNNGVPQGPPVGVHIITIEYDSISGKLGVNHPKDKIMALGMLELAKAIINQPQPSGSLVRLPGGR